MLPPLNNIEYTIYNPNPIQQYKKIGDDNNDDTVDDKPDNPSNKFDDILPPVVIVLLATFTPVFAVLLIKLPIGRVIGASADVTGLNTSVILEKKTHYLYIILDFIYFNINNPSNTAPPIKI